MNFRLSARMRRVVKAFDELMHIVADCELMREVGLIKTFRRSVCKVEIELLSKISM